MLIQYARNKRGQRIGVFVAEKYEGEEGDKSSCVRFGWSKCCKKDIFNKEQGLKIANGRLLVGSNQPIPHSIRSSYNYFVNRAFRYFKVNES